MEKITILKRKQVRRLKLHKEIPVTDLYILQGGESHDGSGSYWMKRDYKDEIKNVTYCLIMQTWINFINPNLDKSYFPYTLGNGVLPVMPLSKLKGKIKETMEDYEKGYSQAKTMIKRSIALHDMFIGIDEIEYGEYPQSIVDENLEMQLENLYQQNKLNKTNKKYKITKIDPCKVDYPYEENRYMIIDCEEYLYDENKYIRVDNPVIWNSREFSDGRDAIGNKTYWVKVEPIKWIIDKEEDIAISKYILANMPLSYHDVNVCYEKSNMKEYLEKYFIKEIIPSPTKQEMPNKDVDMDTIDDLISLMNLLKDNEEKPKQKVR